MSYLAMRDPLTKLHNRAHFSTAVEAAVGAAEAGGPAGALFYVDLDNFKIVNDSLGHAAGDRLLVQMAYLLRNAVRAADTVARFRGATSSSSCKRTSVCPKPASPPSVCGGA